MGIGFDYDVGRKGATVDLPCQVGLWLAPPGSIIVLEDMGPLDGRWIVSTFTRSLFDANADVQLVKPQPKLMEPGTESFKLPTWASGSDKVSQPTGPNDPNQAQFGGIPGMNNADRKSVVAVAKRALAIQAKWPYYYHEVRPMPKSLWIADCHAGGTGIDCSGFCTLVYKEAGCQDPSNHGYDGYEWTSTMANSPNALPVTVPMPGDLAFFGSPPSYTHVALCIGNGQTIECGTSAGVRQDYLAGRGAVYRSYLPR
jgi:hypothetical protein